MGGILTAVGFSPNGDWILGATDNGEVKIWDTSSGRLVCSFFEPDSPLIHAGFTPDGRHVRTATRQGRARIRSVPSGLPVTRAMRGDQFWTVPDPPDSAGTEWLEEVRRQCGAESKSVGTAESRD